MIGKEEPRRPTTAQTRLILRACWKLAFSKQIPEGILLSPEYSKDCSFGALTGSKGFCKVLFGVLGFFEEGFCMV